MEDKAKQNEIIAISKGLEKTPSEVTQLLIDSINAKLAILDYTSKIVN